MIVLWKWVTLHFLCAFLSSVCKTENDICYFDAVNLQNLFIQMYMHTFFKRRTKKKKYGKKEI